MSFETKSKAPMSEVQNKKLRIGSRVPEENREWLKRNGIVAEAVPSQLLSITATVQKKPIYPRVLIGVILVCLTLCTAFFYWGQLKNEDLVFERVRRASMEAANFHLRHNVASLSAVNFFQQNEMQRLSKQIQDLSRQYRGQINGLEKGAAMSDDLRQVYEQAWKDLEAQYDVEILALRKEIGERNKIIATLDGALPSSDEVLVTAPSVEQSVQNLGIKVVAINPDFQFVMIDSGSLNGARVGHMVELYQAGRMIGYGEIEKMYPDYSGVRVFSAAAFARIRLGDAAFIRATE